MGPAVAPSVDPQAVRTEGYDVPRSRPVEPEVKAGQQSNPNPTHRHHCQSVELKMPFSSTSNVIAAIERNLKNSKNNKKVST